MGNPKKKKNPGASRPNPRSETDTTASGLTRRPFYRDPVNILMGLFTLGTLVFLLTYRFASDNQTGFQRITSRFRTQVTRITEGCAKPPREEVEAYYQDDAGTNPVAPDFDADPGELCGNGRKYYCSSLPPDKPVPLGWKIPPRIGADPNYEGPSPFDPFKESPHAMPSSKAILAREPIVARHDPRLAEHVEAALETTSAPFGLVNADALPAVLAHLADRFRPLDVADFRVTDDAQVTAKLEAQGIEYLLFRRTAPLARPWIDEAYDTVELRMRDALPLRHFYPVVLGSGWVLYRRLSTPFDIPTHVKRRITTRIRSILSGATPTDLAFDIPLDGVGDHRHRVIVSLRRRGDLAFKGRKLVKRMGNGATLREALDTAAESIAQNWNDTVAAVRRNFDVNLKSELKDEIGTMEIEVDVLYHHTFLTDRRGSQLVWYIEPGLQGILLAEREGERTIHYLEPSYSLHMEVTSEVQLVERLLSRANLTEFLRPARKKSTRRPMVLHESAFANDTRFDFKRFQTVHWIERPADLGGDIVELYRGVPLKTIWDVSRASLIRSLELGAGWLINNQTENGQYRYKYDPMNRPGRRWTPGANIVRHALNPYTLLMVNKLQQRPEYVESAKRGIDYTLRFLRKRDNRCVICHRCQPARYYNAKLNAVAVTLLSILKLGDVADISEYDDVVRCMAEQMLYMQNKNGHFWQYDVPPDHPYYGAESTIHAGEFIFVLARLYSHYKEERFRIACDKAITFYMQQWDQMVQNRTKEGIYDEEHRVNLIGIVPWMVTAMEDLHKMTGEQRYADLGFRMQDWIDNEFFFWQRRSRFPDYAGASFKVHRELPAVNSCQYSEGAAAAYAISLRTGHDVENRRRLLVLSMRYCLQLQHDGYDSTFFMPEPEESLGGYRYTLGHQRLRNDYNYHAMAAIAMAAEYLRDEDYPDQRPLRIAPTLWELLGGRENPERDMTLEEWRRQQAAATASDTDEGDSVLQETE
jgi:hypothetical protein